MADNCDFPFSNSITQMETLHSLDTTSPYVLEELKI